MTTFVFSRYVGQVKFPPLVLHNALTEPLKYALVDAHRSHLILRVRLLKSGRTTP